MTRPDWQDMAAAYVLDALDTAERRAFEVQLERDASLQAEVRAQREVLAALADSAPPKRAPAGLRERILDEARAARPITSAPSAGVSEDKAGAGAGRSTAAPRSRVRRPVLPWIAAAAAAVAAVALGVSNRQLARNAEALSAALDRSAAVAESTAAQLAARDSLLASFLGPDVRSATLASTGAPPSARIFFNAATGNVVIAAFDLPPAPAGRIYQLWGIPDGGTPVSLGTFQTGADGTAILQRSAPAGSEFAISAVTEEPEGGSEQPTTTPFLVGAWTAQQ